MIIIGLCQQLHWCQPSHSVWCLIVDTYCMLYVKVPQQKIINPMITPMQKNINHKFASHVHYFLDSVLFLVILMLCTDATKTLQFSFFLTIIPEHISSEGSIITV